MKGRVFLVGAGPGDPGLITVKGLKLLRQADVVVYDRLVSREVLREVKPGAELIDVGKVPGERRLEQAAIVKLLIDRARRGLCVVRLKGGDPFLLGRGGEEMAALARAGIPFEVVPGVTSALAAPAAALIPVTYRGLASMLTITTAQEDPLKPFRAVDFQQIGRLAETLVALMVVDQLEVVCAELIAGGLSPLTPAALISAATTPKQQVVEGTLQNLARRATEQGLRPPAVLVVGRVVKVRWEARALLEGYPLVLSFRPRESEGPLEALLFEAGYWCVNLPAAKVVPIARLEEVLEALQNVDYAAFTSPLAARIVLDLIRHDGQQLPGPLSGVRLAAIGPRTADTLRGVGLTVELVPAIHTSAALLKALRERGVEGQRVALFRGEGGEVALEAGLRRARAEVVRVTTHRLEPTGEPGYGVKWIREGRVQALIFTSAQLAGFTAEAFRSQGLDLASVGTQIAVISIGPATSHRLHQLGVKRVYEAGSQTVEGLVAALGQALAGGRKDD